MARWEDALVVLLAVSPMFSNSLENPEWCALRSVSRSLYCASFEVGMKALLPHQWGHFRSLRRGLKAHRRMVDTSIMGSGKSYVAAAIAKDMGLDLVVFAPRSAHTNWRMATKHVGVGLEFYAYSRFAARKKPYTVTLEGSRGRHGVPTPDWGARVSGGIIMVLDECHYLKNNSARSRFIEGLTRDLFASPGRSCVLAISATLFDKPEHAVRFARVLGIVKRRRLMGYNFNTGQCHPEGLADIASFGPGAPSQRLLTMIRWNRRRIMSGPEKRELARTLLMQRVKPLLFRAMKPLRGLAGGDAANLFAPLTDPGDMEMLTAGVARLRRALAAFASRSQMATALGGISGGLRDIEFAKVGLFEGLVRTFLEKHPSSKVIVMLNYRDPITILAARLADTKPLVVEGRTTYKARGQRIAAFQRADGDFRVLIANTSVVAQGVDLDDKHGSFPRLLLISPSYHATTLHQATGRIARVDTASPYTTRFVYAEHEPTEVELLEKLAFKSDVLRGCTRDDGIRYPGDYRCVYKM